MIALDHLVVACRTLDAGRNWSQATFGVAAQPGGRHALMGTHNLLLAISSERFPSVFLELIAIDPDASAPAQPRWFDLDDAALQAAIVAGPRLVHWVARSDDIEATVAALRGAGYDPGPIVAVERMTPRGMLRWRITLPVDGRRPCAGAMPLWIQCRAHTPPRPCRRATSRSSHFRSVIWRPSLRRTSRRSPGPVRPLLRCGRSWRGRAAASS